MASIVVTVTKTYPMEDFAGWDLYNITDRYVIECVRLWNDLHDDASWTIERVP